MKLKNVVNLTKPTMYIENGKIYSQGKTISGELACNLGDGSGWFQCLCWQNSKHCAHFGASTRWICTSELYCLFKMIWIKLLFLLHLVRSYLQADSKDTVTGVVRTQDTLAFAHCIKAWMRHFLTFQRKTELPRKPEPVLFTDIISGRKKPRYLYFHSASTCFSLNARSDSALLPVFLFCQIVYVHILKVLALSAVSHLAVTGLCSFLFHHFPLSHSGKLDWNWGNSLSKLFFWCSEYSGAVKIPVYGLGTPTWISTCGQFVQSPVCIFCLFAPISLHLCIVLKLSRK